LLNNADHYRVRVSAAVLRTRDELLVVRESRRALEILNLPGGVPKLGESIEEAVVREVLEETGYHINPTEIAFVAERRDDRWSTVTLEICFYAEIVSGDRAKPVEQDAVFAVEWLPLDHREVRSNMPYAELFPSRKRGRYLRAESRAPVS
ncbi:MAG TPA: NUDIX hydrolase, partial [Candidatus Aquilonibacter sp.]